MFPLGILTYKDSNVPFILNIGGTLESLGTIIENISIKCNINVGCPHFIHGIKG